MAAADTAPNGMIAYSIQDETGYNIYAFDPETPGDPGVRAHHRRVVEQQPGLVAGQHTNRVRQLV